MRAYKILDWSYCLFRSCEWFSTRWMCSEESSKRTDYLFRISQKACPAWRSLSDQHEAHHLSSRKVSGHEGSPEDILWPSVLSFRGGNGCISRLGYPSGYTENCMLYLVSRGGQTGLAQEHDSGVMKTQDNQSWFLQYPHCDLIQGSIKRIIFLRIFMIQSNNTFDLPQESITMRTM